MNNPEDNDPVSKTAQSDAQLAREKFLKEKHDAMVPPAPEVDTECTPVPRTELVSPLPKEGNDVHPWKPGKENAKDIE